MFTRKAKHGCRWPLGVRGLLHVRNAVGGAMTVGHAVSLQFSYKVSYVLAPMKALNITHAVIDCLVFF